LIGRLEKDIGIETYIKVLRELKKRSIAYSLDVCGTGEYMRHLAKYGSLHGFVSDTTSYIKGADVVFASSYLTILDALSYGKAVCAVYENSLKEDYLKDSPFAKWLCINSQPSEIVEYITGMQTHGFVHPELPAIKKYINRTTWRNVADSYIQLWKK
jgi:glycosyltransferase involved in cell wall biosynthesis